MRIIDKIKDYLIREEWSIAIRKRENLLLFEKGGTSQPFTVLKNSFRYWAADPFLIEKGDKDYIFFEMFDRIKGKGLIGYREIANGKIGKMKIAYEHPTHLSFPFIFECNGGYYMMPESSKDQTLPLLKAISFPDQWERIDLLKEGQRFVDSVLFFHDGLVYLFTQPIQNSYSFDKLEVYIKQEDSWIPHKMNPVITGFPENARLAGKVFNNKGQIIRVSQDCSDEYGKTIAFHEITKLSKETYKERKLNEQSVEGISVLTNQTFFGIHTYNSDARYEVVDLKKKERIHLVYLLSFFYRNKIRIL